MSKEENQELRETIVLKAISLDKTNYAELEHFDAFVCHALGLDAEQDPPFFIDEALSSS
tara:strand:- start:996 stop:1172 length:177 start_codon:yes stop_codon:yes gene_type:complete